MQSPQHRRFRLRGGHRLELEHRTAGEQGAVHIEVGILRGGGDEGQLPVLHKFQEALLLLLVEILDLIQVQQNPAGGHQGAHVGDDVLDILQGGGGSVETVEGLLGLLGDDVGDGGLAGAGGPVKNHVCVSAALNEPAQYRAGGKQVPLSHHLVQRFGPDLICQGASHVHPSFHTD